MSDKKVKTIKKETIKKDTEPQYQDFPLEEIQEAVMEEIRENRTFHQKVTCVECGKRLTVDKPNTLYKKVICDNCGKTTNVEDAGCNYLASPPEGIDDD